MSARMKNVDNTRIQQAPIAQPVQSTPAEDPSPFSRAATAADPSERHERIARAAYHRAQARGFEPGQDMEDWLQAEREIDAESRDAGQQHRPD